MCGIVGAVGGAAARASREARARASESLRHRGPDDDGVFTGPGPGAPDVWLAHRRLSIIDLSPGGHQPMVRGALAIVYNGEIYNFRELARELGGPFESSSDTEVLLRLYERDGPRCVERLRGMFAFAIWDGRRRELFAARDPLGIKPFYYAPGGDGMAFASELGALRALEAALGGFSLDRAALVDYFTHKCVPAPRSIYREVRKLEPAHTLHWDERTGVRVRRYWEPSAETVHRDEGPALELLGERLRDAVVSHTLADVPVGVFLSGGVDSSSIVAQLPGCRTFTVGFDERGADAEYARAVARHFGTEHAEETVGAPDLEHALDDATRIYDEPFGDSSGWATFVVSRVAQRKVKVALSGEGADELFSGYGRYERFLRPPDRGPARWLAPWLPAFSAAGVSLARRSARGFERYATLASTFTPAQSRALLADDLVERDYDRWWHLRAHWREELEPVKRMQWIDLHTYLPDDLLVKADRASMATSLEVRPPFLDLPLVELALSLDGRLLRRSSAGADGAPDAGGSGGNGANGKWLLRRALERRLPAAVLDRPKQGFSMPVRRWSERHPALLDHALARLARAGILRSARRPRLGGEQIWSLLALDRWLADAGAL